MLAVSAMARRDKAFEERCARQGHAPKGYPAPEKSIRRGVVVWMEMMQNER